MLHSVFLLFNIVRVTAICSLITNDSLKIQNQYQIEPTLVSFEPEHMTIFSRRYLNDGKFFGLSTVANNEKESYERTMLIEPI